MKIFNNRHVYVVNNTKNYSKVSKKENNLQFINNLKKVRNSTITRKKVLFNSNFFSGRKEKQRNMRDLISKSYVVPDSGHIANSNFVNTPRFNGIVTDVTASEKRELLKDSAEVMNGNIRPLTGKGIISGTTKNDNFPVAYDYVRSDKEDEFLNKKTSNINYGIECYNGDKIRSAEIIPGTPIGNYYNKQKFNQDLRIIQLNHGKCGTVGFRLDINQLKPDKPLLIHGGGLSSCTMVYGLKDNYFYAFHSGQPGNDRSLWKTETDGAKSIIDSHKKLTDSVPNTEKAMDNDALSDYLHNNFDLSMMAFCGHGKNVSSRKNVFSFDYNKPSTLVEINKARVANTMAVLVNEGGKIKIDMFSDDMIIDKQTLKTKSIEYIMSDPVEKTTGKTKNEDEDDELLITRL